jgi:hypothetical protein
VAQVDLDLLAPSGAQFPEFGGRRADCGLSGRPEFTDPVARVKDRIGAVDSTFDWRGVQLCCGEQLAECAVGHKTPLLQTENFKRSDQSSPRTCFRPSS